MTEPSLALQKLLRARLLASPDVVGMVDPDDIGDIGALPATFPCINIGEGTAVYSNNHNTFHEWASSTVHVWTDEPALELSKTITQAVRDALKQAPWHVAGFVCHAINVSNARFLRDPSGQHGHAVLTVDAVLQTKAAA